MGIVAAVIGFASLELLAVQLKGKAQLAPAKNSTTLTPLARTANIEQRSLPPGWDTYTNTKYHYSFSFPHQPQDAQTLGVVSSDKTTSDLFGSSNMEVLKAGLPEPDKAYFSVEVADTDSFDQSVTNITQTVAYSNQSNQEQYRKGLMPRAVYEALTFTLPQRIVFQNYPAVTFEGQTTKRLLISLGHKNMWLLIDKENAIGNQIFSTFRLSE